MTLKPRLPFLETMITQVCNLSCTGCTNYSDLSHSGYVGWEQGKQWIQAWLERIDIPDFGIMGGEPLINPEWQHWVLGVRQLMPTAQIRFTTNGLLLSRHPDIVDFFNDVGNVSFKITVHVADAKLENLIDQIRSAHNWTAIHEYGIDRWINSQGIRFHVKRPDRFVKSYQGQYTNMSPWQSKPHESFENCVQQTCPLLYKGKIFKCSTSGLLADVLNQIGRPNYSLWQPYLIPGLAPDCSQQDLEAFIENFGKPHGQCSQCPSAQHRDSILDHRMFVKQK